VQVALVLAFRYSSWLVRGPGPYSNTIPLIAYMDPASVLGLPCRRLEKTVARIYRVILKEYLANARWKLS
jgi:hypothetical protein